jgi:DnaK suppressor protein
MGEDDDLDLNLAKERLQALRSELSHAIEEEEDSTRPVEVDQARIGRLSRLDAIQAQAMSVETERRRLGELRRVDEALERIEEGEYGFCLECGEPINPKRLAVDPAASLCIRCATAAEE